MTSVFTFWRPLLRETVDGQIALYGEKYTAAANADDAFRTRSQKTCLICKKKFEREGNEKHLFKIVPF